MLFGCLQILFRNLFFFRKDLSEISKQFGYNSLDPVKSQHFVESYLSLNCLQGLSAGVVGSHQQLGNEKYNAKFSIHAIFDKPLVFSVST